MTEKRIPGHWIAQVDDLETINAEMNIKRIVKDLGDGYKHLLRALKKNKSWGVYEIMNNPAMMMWMCNCGHGEDAKKHAKMIAKLHNDQKESNRLTDCVSNPNT